MPRIANSIRYIALGDSVSISLYPDLDASTRLGRRITGLGAPELVVHNDDTIWPAFTAQDLGHLFADVLFENVAVDGGTIEDVQGPQLRRLAKFDADLVTLTVGGNDLLGILGRHTSRAGIGAAVQNLQHRYRECIARVRQAAPRALLIVGTVYDPSDGTGQLPGWPPLPIDLLNPLNDTIREIVSNAEATALSDIHALFMGHGITAPVAERYYWSESIIEPSMLGASEIRRDWVTTIQSHFAV